jgi:hypothetical protein
LALSLKLSGSLLDPIFISDQMPASSSTLTADELEQPTP